MLKNLIVLSDGTEISSGAGEVNAIGAVTLTECVNSGQELTLGSVCAAMLEATLIAPAGGLSLEAGTEAALYKVDDLGSRTKVGLFTLEKPTRTGTNTYKLTAYDRVSWLDKDLTAWLAGLNGWPYGLYEFAELVCQECGLILANSSIPNGDYSIRKFTADGITGRQLMTWVGEAAGRFCRATPEGLLELAWYTPSGVSLGPEGERFFYRGSLSYEDYTVAPIGKVRLRQTESDVGVTYGASGGDSSPVTEDITVSDGVMTIGAVGAEIAVFNGAMTIFDTAGEDNSYIVTGNYLLTADSPDALRPIAQSLYETLQGVSYTPCKVSIPACLDIHAGNTVTITDTDGKTVTAYIMTKTQTGQRDTLECTGSPRRDSTTAVNTQNFKALSGKVLEIKTSIEGLSVTAKELQSQSDSTAERIADLELTAEEIKTTVSETKTEVKTYADTQAQAAETAAKGYTDDALVSYSTTTQVRSMIDQKADEISLSVEKTNAQVAQAQATADGAQDAADILSNTVDQEIARLDVKTDGITAQVSKQTTRMDRMEQSVSTLRQTADSVSVEIQSIKENGVDRVTTQTGYTFNEDGLTISKSGQEMENKLDNTGMYVTRSGETVLQANNQGVVAVDVTVGNYLIVGTHARFEDFGTGQTACFYI